MSTATAEVADPEWAVGPVTPTERAVLLGIRRRVLAVEAAPTPPAWQRWDAERHAELVEFGPLYTPSLVTGRDEYVIERDRGVLLKAVHALAARGLVVATRRFGRLRWVRLTPAGRLLADSIAADARVAGAEMSIGVPPAGEE